MALNHVRSAAQGGTGEISSGGLAGWLLAKLRGGRGSGRQAPRLALVERISLAPKQSLALVEAEGRRFLVASSAEGAASFYPIEDAAQNTVRPRGVKARVSW